MVMPNNQQQQEGYPHVIPCYDDLFAFVKDYWSKFMEKPILYLNRYSGNSEQYQSVVKWSVSDQCTFGELNELSVVCNNYTPLYVTIKVAGRQVQNLQLQTRLTLPYRDLRLRPKEVVEILCKSDGSTSINFDAEILGKEKFKLS